MNGKTIKNTGIILGCSIVAKILSYVWEAILASYLGASDQADAFYMMSSITAILYPILDLGIWKVFLPVYKTKLVQGGETSAEKIANIVVTLFLLLSAALVLFLIVFARPLVVLIAPGFSPEKKLITIRYLRLSAPAYLLMASASVVGAILQSREKFLGSQIREIGTHVSKIVFILLCFRYMGIYAAVIAMIIGSIFRLLIQLPFINWGWSYRPDFNFRDAEISPMLRGLPSVSITAAISHVNGMVDKIVASGTISGAIACLNYGHKLVNVFSGMISTAISTAVYPTIIQNIAEAKEEYLKELLRSVISALMFFIIPISLFCILFSEKLVIAAFQRGAFDTAATALTSEVFIGYCIGMLFTGVSSIVTNVFYGYGDTKITMRISVLSILLNIIFDLLFVKIWGVAGLAVATSLSSGICLSIRFLYLKKYVIIDYRKLAEEFLRIILLSFLACFVPYLLVTKIVHLNVYLSLGVALFLCIAIYFILAFLFKLNTINFVKMIIENRYNRK